MGTSNYSDGFKRDAVQQIRVRGYPVREVSQRFGVSSHSLYKWLKLYGKPVAKSVGVDHEVENQRLKRELARVTEERDILKKQRRTSRASPNGVCLHPGASDQVPRQGHVPGVAGSRERVLCIA
jgi:transposase-like protein